MKNFILNETNWKQVKDSSFNVAILPWGATEAHNYHLPYSTDNIESEFIASESAAIAASRGAKVIVLPVIPYGVNTGQMNVKLCINLNPSTQALILNDVVTSLNYSGIYKLIILNSHGGNEFKPVVRELSLKIPSVFISIINWYKVLRNEDYFDEPGDHAGEMETSILLNAAPGLVLPVSEAGDGKENQFKITALKEGWAWAQREWTKISADTGVGNPKNASKEKGENFLNDLTAKIAEFIVELDKADIKNLYD
jgi:creatinine amidohydrolase